MTMSRLKYVFVHGLSGWGSYDPINRRIPYWGMQGGDLTAYLREKGYDSYAASVSPIGSAWDRACELYAQIFGTITDYGVFHSMEMRHGRFGKDFSGEPLIPEMTDDTRLVLIGHSFGGATIRLFARLMADGSEKERKLCPGDSYSGLFSGNKAGMIHSIVTLASPHNGSTVYDLFEDEDFDPESVEAPVWSDVAVRMLSVGKKNHNPDGRSDSDFADHDMHMDNAAALNRKIGVLPDTYYFSYPLCCTEADEAGHQIPIQEITEPVYMKRSLQIGCYIGVTDAGIVADESWQANDGLVNTISAYAPATDPQRPFDPKHTEPGIWNIMPVIRGDHMSIHGGFLRREDIRPFFLKLVRRIEKLDARTERSGDL
ncbi:MAG: hypothetical protein K6F53_00625 [Lachnospiraceae bacterium]|nr:hypothetical protein [Lachnospiraceae bacterium]